MDQKEQCILVVEDEKDIREILQEALEMEGYRVVTANNGQDGISKLESMPAPCLILLDLMMPVMDGWEFRRIQKEDAKISSIPVVVVSAAADRAGSLHADAYFKKPVDLDALLRTISKYCT